MKKYKSWDDYLADQPQRGKDMLEQLRELVPQILPNIIESWGYGVPAYDLVPNASLDAKIMIAGFAKHISFYPSPETIHAFMDELDDYKVLKSTIQIKHTQELPLNLLKRMILHRYNAVMKHRAST